MRAVVLACDFPQHRYKRVIWGAALMAAGAAWLLAGRGGIPGVSPWLILPALVGASGVVELVLSRSVRGFLRAALQLVVAAWLFACFVPGSGVSFGATWPAALLIYLGLRSLFRALPRNDRDNSGCAP